MSVVKHEASKPIMKKKIIRKKMAKKPVKKVTTPLKSEDYTIKELFKLAESKDPKVTAISVQCHRTLSGY